jgi:hypothetical protein
MALAAAAGQYVDNSFPAYLSRYANEKADLKLDPGTERLYIFTFQQLKEKKAPFQVTVLAGQDSFVFRFKD